MTKEELRGILQGITDEQLRQILEINSSDVKEAKAEEDRLRTSLGEAQERLTVLEQSQREAEDLKTKYQELQKVVEKRAEEDRIAGIQGRFQAVSGKAEFLNSFTREGVFSKFSQAIEAEENQGKSDSEIFAEITQGIGNLFVEDNPIPVVVASTSGFGGDLTDGDIREIMGLSS